MKELIFTVDWFSNVLPLWTKTLSKYKNNEVHVLLVGIYEGRSLIWLFENILTHPGCTVTVVNDFTNNKVNVKTLRKLRPAQSTLSTLKHNIETLNIKEKVDIYDGVIIDMLRKPEIMNKSYDIVYVGGGLHSKHILQNGVLSFPMLKPGGLQIYDNYTSNREHDSACPKQAVDAFMDIYASEIKVKKISWNVVIEKRKTPLKVRNCNSEYYT